MTTKKEQKFTVRRTNHDLQREQKFVMWNKSRLDREQKFSMENKSQLQKKEQKFNVLSNKYKLYGEQKKSTVEQNKSIAENF
jgi:hypothetical protein